MQERLAWGRLVRRRGRGVRVPGSQPLGRSRTPEDVSPVAGPPTPRPVTSSTGVAVGPTPPARS
jgi:hypothetical protein